MLFMFFAVSAFAISVTLITQAFLKIGERKRVFNEDMAFARMHLRNIQASETLQSKVKSFLTHLYSRRRIQAKEANLFGQLPPSLTKLMKYSTIMVHLRKVETLVGFDKKAIFAVSELVDVRDLVPGERLSIKGAVATAAWVLVVGLLRIVTDGRSMTGRRSSEGYSMDASVQVVDEDTLGSRRPVVSTHTIVAGTCCEVIYISKKKFFKLFKDMPFADAGPEEVEGQRVGDPGSQFVRQTSPEEDGESEEEGPSRQTAVKHSAHVAAIMSA
mmetsp:Transcript_60715/g.146762  ORF Transcript_60715/g.146762 Transcript_60715/m.146762 type:complete len:272 (-) Transcript_60715:129-944(-)